MQVDRPRMTLPPEDQSVIRQRQVLSQHGHDAPEDWDLCLPCLTFSHNTGGPGGPRGEHSPYLFMYGRLPRDPGGLGVPMGNCGTVGGDPSDTVYAIFNFSCNYNHIPELATDVQQVRELLDFSYLFLHI